MEVPVTLYQEIWNKMNFPIFHNHQHPASTASFISLFFILYYTEKKALHKSASFFEVSVALTLGLVIPVYCRQTGFSSASINFYEKLMVETELTGCEENMAMKGQERKSCENVWQFSA